MMMDMGPSDLSAMFANGETPDTYCYLGEHNGTFANGTLAAGTWKWGKYNPTAAIKAACQDPRDGTVKYAYWTVYVILGLLFASALVNHLQNFNMLTRSMNRPPLPLLPPRLLAAFRAFSTPRPRPSLPPRGSLLAAIIFLAFGLLVCLVPRPYMRPTNFGTPPLGLRAEWVATVPLIFVCAAGTKWNMLGWLTGLSLGRLMDLHKMGGWIMLVFSVIHTVPMIIRGVQQGPWTWKIYSAPLSYGWPAWGALITLGWLCLLSLAPARRLSHETFYVLHMVNVLLFVLFMYYHTLGEGLGSWGYLDATVVILGLAVVHRFGVVAYNTRGFTRVWRAWVEPTEDGALLIKIPARGFSWSAGDHVYVRFLTVYAWQTHPFTIMNLPHPDPSSPFSELHILLRPRTGLTAKLAKHAVLRPHLSFPVHLDGPYAATSNVLTTLAGSDEVLLVAGGTGMSYVLPLMGALARGGVGRREQGVRVVWVVPRKACVGWYRTEIGDVMAHVAAARKLTGSVTSLSITVYVTSELPDADVETQRPVSSKEEEGDALLGSGAGGIEYVFGRPDVAAIVGSAVRRTEGVLAVAGCGPTGLLNAVRGEVARAQVAIATGRAGGLDEVVYVEELFE